MSAEMAPAHRNDAVVIWNYHRMYHETRACSAAICIGGPDPGIAAVAANLYHQRMFPTVVFSGSNSPDTRAWYPRGEAVGLRDMAADLGIPEEAMLVEPKASNTGENIALSRDLLLAAGIEVSSLMLIQMPYMERRAYATCRHTWPEVDVVCASEDLDFDSYASRIGNPSLAVDMIVGDLQRITIYPDRGFAVHQHVPDAVMAAYHRLLEAGYTSRLAST